MNKLIGVRDIHQQGLGVCNNRGLSLAGSGYRVYIIEGGSILYS